MRAVRPAIIAAAVLATARALGEAIMLSMVSGSVGFAPNPLDGLTFFLEPTRPLAATIVDNADGLSVVPFGADAVRIRGRAARLGDDPLVRRLGRQAAAQALRGGDLMEAASSRAPLPARPSEAAESSASWPLIDRIGLGLCWAAGILLCLIAAAIVGYMLIRGVQYLRPDLLFSHPLADLDQSKTGGFFDPLIGTFMLTVLGTALAAPLGVATAVWLTEYGRPFWLARAVESGVEVVAGTPSIVLAIFGLIVFSQGIFGFLSFTAEGGAVFGRSFFAAGAMMSLIALPLVVGSTREALQAIPRHVREASYALGKTQGRDDPARSASGRAPRRRHRHGARHGPDRGDTAIVVILLGASLQLTGAGGIEPFDTLRGTGSTLTSYVYNNSPAGEGNAPEKAYASAFVLLVIVVALNFAVDMIGRRRSPTWNV